MRNSLPVHPAPTTRGGDCGATLGRLSPTRVGHLRNSSSGTGEAIEQRLWERTSSKCMLGELGNLQAAWVETPLWLRLRSAQCQSIPSFGTGL